jgi:uncharacterized membrane protein
LMGPVNWPAAVIFYLIYILGIVLFAIQPALAADSLQKAVLLGAALGFFAYATYDLTNLATLKDWPVLLVVVDIAWGTFLTGAVAAAGYWLSKTIIFSV